MAGVFNFTPIIKGSTLRPLEFTLTSLKDGSVITLTGVTPYWQIKHRAGDDEILHHLDCEVSDDLAGKIRLNVWDVTLPEGSYVHELTLDFPNDGKIPLFRGQFTVILNITEC